MNEQIIQPKQTPQYSIAQLQQYVQLAILLTGKKPEQIVISKEYLTWYQEQVKQLIKDFNIPTTKENKKDIFMGVELIVDGKEK